MVPVRAAPVAAATLNSTAAVPFPEPPDRMLIHGESADEVQVHSVLEARTSNAPDPPSSPKLFDGSESVYPHSPAA
jgi:hypothetical protein